MSRQATASAICGFVLTGGLTVHATFGPDANRRIVVPDQLGTIPKDPALRPFAPASSLRIQNVRLEGLPADAPTPSLVLKFEMLNDGDFRVTDVVLQIAIVEQHLGEHEWHLPPVVVAPFTIRASVTIEAGYAVNYEMLLRNLSSDCKCVANVGVVSARPLFNSAL